MTAVTLGIGGPAILIPAAASPSISGCLAGPILGVAETADGNGYWLIGADGAVFAFGDAAAPTQNPLPGEILSAPVVGAAFSGAESGWSRSRISVSMGVLRVKLAVWEGP